MKLKIDSKQTESFVSNKTKQWAILLLTHSFQQAASWSICEPSGIHRHQMHQFPLQVSTAKGNVANTVWPEALNKALYVP